jgi:hypothetical protein
LGKDDSNNRWIALNSKKLPLCLQAFLMETKLNWQKSFFFLFETGLLNSSGLLTFSIFHILRQRRHDLQTSVTNYKHKKIVITATRVMKNASCTGNVNAC